MNSTKPAGVVLAGGRSSRMGVSHKALLELGGQTIMARVLGRLKTQLDPIVLSCESDNSAFDAFDLPLVPDLLADFQGPLSGLYSALRYLSDQGHENGLVLCPCDAPFIPQNLVEVLLDAHQGSAGAVVVVSYQGELQPTFSLWQNHHLEVIEEAVTKRGMGGLKYMLKSLPHEVVVWPPEEPSPFFNVNTPEDLNKAEDWLEKNDI
jgi:molybdopterin-guanine dinucleotide biosynthesis protein A